jgi:hypothetical protein
MTVKLVLLHSPLVGPGTWRLLIPLLRSHGHDVAVADFSAVMAGTGPYYPQLVQCARAVIGNSRNYVLIAHSAAGVLIPALAEQGDAIGAIFVDALLPRPSRSWLDTAPAELISGLEKLACDGRVPPWHLWWPRDAVKSLVKEAATFEKFAAELNELPFAYFNEVTPASVLAQNFATAYLQLSAGYAAEAAIAERNGWPVRRLSLHHLAMLTHCDEVASEIELLVRRLAVPKA